MKLELAPAYDIDSVLLDDVTREDLDRFLKSLCARGFGASQQKRTTSIMQRLPDAANALPRPKAKRLGDVIRQQSHHLSCNAGLGLEVPEFDNVPVNRP